MPQSVGSTLARAVLGLAGPALTIACVAPAVAAEVVTSASCAQIVARIVSIQGTLALRRAGEQEWTGVSRLDTAVCKGDELRTGRNSRAALVIPPEKFVRLDQSSTISITLTDRETIVEMVEGEQSPKNACGGAYLITRFPRSFKVRTRYLNAAVEGTEFSVGLSCIATTLSVVEGKVRTELPQASAAPVLVTSGHTISARQGEAPVTIALKPLDAAQWTLYYPPLSRIRATADQDCATAEGDDHAGCLTARAEQRLRVGRLDDAQADIREILARRPQSADADALLAIIAIAKNEKQQALDLAVQATRLDPTSPLAWIALSYAHQAAFKLEDALAAAQHAAELAPRNSIAQARLAELLMSLGRLRSAERAARAAVEADPDESRAHAILGFAQLAQIDPRAARGEFLAAIERDSADPLPRLGLGLAMIRQGNLTLGREQIEIAVALDPTSSLLRSYVGKAYYEENTGARDKLAGTQFGLAKQLDPNDPTPWLYDAVRKDADNRPVEAVSELQRSIELNDNRAVNRSRLLLDDDRAARSASLARIYNEIGFQQLALAEGYRAVEDDPTDYSAHRFLADAYLNQPNQEVGRLSELLQSQLRQPENLQPLQPQLGETGLFIVPGTGPAQPSYNEYNRLFARNGLNLYADGIAGSNSTYGNDAVLSLLTDRASLSIGQFHYETDGFRPNDDQKRDLLTAFGQFNVSSDTSLQVEARTIHSDVGDLQLRFDPNNFFPDDRDKKDVDTYRMGLRHDISADSQIIVSALTQRSHEEQEQFRTVPASFNFLPPPFPPIPGTIASEAAGAFDQRAYLAEAQWLGRWSSSQLIVGGGWFDAHNQTFIGTSALGIPQPPFPSFPIPIPDVVSDIDAHQANGYAYWDFRLPDRFRWTLGLSVSDYVSQSAEGTQVNPKLGLVWTPLSGTTIRAAAFRTLQRDLVADQTIEPTQIAGFNQLFDENAATDARRVGFGVDQRFSNTLFGGFELTHARLKEPVTTQFEPVQINVVGEAHQDLDRAYLYWAPVSWAALRSEYLYQKLDQPPTLVTQGFSYLTLRTERAPLGFAVFGPAGFSFSATTSWVRQKGTFLDTVTGDESQGSSTFWLTDLQLQWRLPRRAGTIAVGVENLFDRRFSYFEPDPANPTVYPERFWYARFELSL